MRCTRFPLVLVAILVTALIGPDFLGAQETRGGWTVPAGGWAYSFEGDQNPCDRLAGGAGPPCEVRLDGTWTAGVGLTELAIEVNGQETVLLDDPTAATTTLDIDGLDGPFIVTLTPTACFSDCQPIQCVVGGTPDPTFRRGDSNNDSRLDLSDAVSTLGFLFLGGAPLVCSDSADTNDDGKVDLSDAVSGLNYLFLGGTPPPAPGPTDCGFDPTVDSNTECDYTSC